MKKIFSFLLLFFFVENINAQHQDVFPGVTGDDLLENLVDTYKLNAFPDQAENRDTLFGVVDNRNDSLICVYTNFKIYLNPNGDPTQEAFSKDINTEHTFPKSLGAEGFAEGDMHHLYPTRADVNNDRGNLPFGEIPDNQADSWYYLAQETSSIPQNNIDLYSERTDGLFEPPEAHKGNVARSMMYFYTMYKDAADAANPNFFENQRETLCAWHYFDPVDQAEWDRTWKIAEYQEGKPNPFVLDCTLPERSFCQNLGESCIVNTVEVDKEKIDFSFDKIIPNPIKDGAFFYFSNNIGGEAVLEIFNLQGEKLDSVYIGKINAGENSFYWENENKIPAGVIICKLNLSNKNVTKIIATKALVIK